MVLRAFRQHWGVPCLDKLSFTHLSSFQTCYKLIGSGFVVSLKGDLTVLFQGPAGSWLVCQSVCLWNSRIIWGVITETVRNVWSYCARILWSSFVDHLVQPQSVSTLSDHHVSKIIISRKQQGIIINVEWIMKNYFRTQFEYDWFLLDVTASSRYYQLPIMHNGKYSYFLTN